MTDNHFLTTLLYAYTRIRLTKIKLAKFNNILSIKIREKFNEIKI